MSGTIKSGGLLDQHKLLGAIINADWSTCLDHKVAWAILENYYAKYNNSRAALRYLVKATGAKQNSSIIGSLRRIVKHGAITITRLGSGTRATEFLPNFDFAVAAAPPLSSDLSGGLQDTTEVAAPPPLDTLSGGLQDTESFLRSRPTGRPTEGRTPAGPLDGLTPAAIPAGDKQASKGGPLSGFDELWAAWLKKKMRVEAKHAYAKLAPDAELHATLVQSATEWTANYIALDKAERYRKHLHIWLRDECWLEDLPNNDNESRTSRAAKPKGEAKASSGAGGAPTGSHVVAIVSSDINTNADGESLLSFRHRISGGKLDGQEFTHQLKLSDSNGNDVEGCGTFLDLRKATGVLEPEDMADFIGKVLCANVSKAGYIKYMAASPAGE